jgi:hypothetical protein
MSQCENFELLFFLLLSKSNVKIYTRFYLMVGLKMTRSMWTVDAQSICEKVVTLIMNIIIRFGYFLKYFLFKNILK